MATETENQSQTTEQNDSVGDGKEIKETKVDDKKVSESDGKQDPIVEYKLALSEGSQLEKTRVDEIVAFAKENKISPETAQKILDGESNAVTRYAKAQSDAWEQQSETWVKEVENDKEIGGEHFKKHVELAHRVFKKFGSEKLGQELDRTGLGNHPELLRLAVRIGKAMGDDSFVMAPKGAGRGAEKSIEQVLYPSHYKENNQ